MTARRSVGAPSARAAAAVRQYDSPMPVPVREVVAHPQLLALAAPSADSASGRLSLVIIGLVVLAVVITIATVLFWRTTRPEVHVPPSVTGPPHDTRPAPEPDPLDGPEPSRG